MALVSVYPVRKDPNHTRRPGRRKGNRRFSFNRTLDARTADARGCFGSAATNWKLDLIQTINDVLEYARTPDEFIDDMEREGHQVTWTDTRKHVTFTCPNGRRCRDSSLRDETFLKENLEALFVYRQMTGFHGGYSEPAAGWLGEASQGLLQLGEASGTGRRFTSAPRAATLDGQQAAPQRSNEKNQSMVRS